MHGSVGLHSAMAIKRQRKAREEKRRAKERERERRMSSPTTSQSSLDVVRRRRASSAAPPDHRLATSIGMLHLGVVFLVLGFFLIASGLLPSDMVAWKSGGWWNELVGTGLFASALGIFLITLNRIMSKKEEEDLNQYVRGQLTRSRSGHRLERDTETGCLATKQHRRMLQLRREDVERGLENLPSVHVPNSPTIKVPHVVYAPNGDAPHLEKILEEDGYSERTEDELKRADLIRETVSTTTTASLSPGSPSETRELLTNGRYLPMCRM